MPKFVLVDRITGQDWQIVPKGISEEGKLEFWASLVDGEAVTFPPYLIRMESWEAFFERFGLCE